MQLGSTQTAAATSTRGKRDPLTFNGKVLERTAWTTLDLQGEFASEADALFKAEAEFKAKLQAAIEARAKPAGFDANKHRVMLTTNYGKWSFVLADKSAKRGTVSIG